MHLLYRSTIFCIPAELFGCPFGIVCAMLMTVSRAAWAQLKGLSYAEVLQRGLCVLSLLSFDYRPGIGCRE